MDGDSDDKPYRDDWSFTLNVSVFSNAFPWLKNMYISAGRNRAVDEPVSYTAGVKKIGADGTFLTPEDRGIMTLDMIELDHQLSEEQKMISSSHRRSPSLPWFNLGKTTK